MISSELHQWRTSFGTISPSYHNFMTHVFQELFSPSSLQKMNLLLRISQAYLTSQHIYIRDNFPFSKMKHLYSLLYSAPSYIGFLQPHPIIGHSLILKKETLSSYKVNIFSSLKSQLSSLGPKQTFGGQCK